MARTRRVSAAQEDYLEAILDLAGETGTVRAGAIARLLSVHKSTVTAALKTLAAKGLIRYAPYDVASLSVRGKKIAGEITRRHRLIEAFLTEILLLSPEVARRNACRMEHAMDSKTLARLAVFAAFIRDHPIAREDWPRHFALHLTQSSRRTA